MYSNFPDVLHRISHSYKLNKLRNKLYDTQQRLLAAFLRFRLNPTIRPLPDTPRVTLYTTCMGREEQINHTFVKNIEDNSDYPNLEWVLINYNSPGGLEAWAKEKLIEYIKEDKVSYFRIINRHDFHMAHAKNVGARLCRGDIVCNVDADHFTGKHFVRFLVDTFRTNNKLIVHGHPAVTGKSSGGRIAHHKDVLSLLGGYDETMLGWGFEDADFVNRANALGFPSEIVQEASYMVSLSHSDSERVAHCKGSQDVWHSHEINKQLAQRNYRRGRFVANKGEHWGSATFYRNFSNELEEV